MVPVITSYQSRRMRNRHVPLLLTATTSRTASGETGMMCVALLERIARQTIGSVASNEVTLRTSN
jgi:hypothetical protein